MTIGEKCPVCGHRSAEAVCPRCGTILLRDQAICPRCGAMYRGPVAHCDACGREIEVRPADPDEATAVRGMTLVPGLDEATARQLYRKGFHDFSDVLRETLPRRAVDRGLHVTIARKLVLAELSPSRAAVPETVVCAECGESVPAGTGTCPSCGTSLAPEDQSRAIERKLAQITGVVPHLESDPDFRTMPEAVRLEIVQALGASEAEEGPYPEMLQQVEAWRRKGFDVTELERLLAEDPESFRSRGVRMIRSQILKRRNGATFRCPLCDETLEPAVEECGSCGAKFA